MKPIANIFLLLETLDTGHPIRDTQNLDVARTVATFRYMAGIADKIDGRVVQVDPGFHNYVLREPVGVVGSIVPWNFPYDVCELEARLRRWRRAIVA